jgi:pSer/pThr/pTyr-binding forkhead associated (FHA) protein
MTDPSPLARHAATAAELQQRMATEARGQPFLVYRDDQGAQRLVELSADRTELTVGRREENDIALAWDGNVSRLHAQIVRVARDWMVVDAGLSQNGTFVNEARVGGQRRLRSGDLIRFGSTVVAFVAPSGSRGGTTAIAAKVQVVVRIPPAQKRVLVALCRPLRDGSPLASPATNPQIAEELYLSVDAVKTHMRALYKAFELESLPQQHKRAQLAQRALLAGIVAREDLEDP